MPQFLKNRHPDFWRDPGRFDPGRFDPGTARHPAAWFPFSISARRCIGDMFAMVEMALVMAMVLQRGRLVRTDDEPLGWHARLSLRPDRPVLARPEPRPA